MCFVVEQKFLGGETSIETRMSVKTQNMLQEKLVWLDYEIYNRQELYMLVRVMEIYQQVDVVESILGKLFFFSNN